MQYFFTKSLTISKLTQIGTSKTYQYVEQDGSYDCTIQQASPEEAQMIDGNIGNVFNCYTSTTCPAVVSDKITIDSIDYKVRAREPHEFGSLDHIKLILVKTDAS